MKINQHYPEAAFYVIYVFSHIVSYFFDPAYKLNLALGILSALAAATVALFFYKWQLKKRDAMVAWLMSLFWPLVLIYYIFIVPIMFILKLFDSKNGGHSRSSNSSSSMADRVVEAQRPGQLQDIRILEGTVEARRKKLQEVQMGISPEADFSKGTAAKLLADAERDLAEAKKRLV